MRYKVEMKYFYGWDDAGWTEEINGENRPLRFHSVDQAQAGMDEFYAGVKAAVVAGDMDVEAERDDYRIVETNDSR
jgi:hypothetical protein